MSKHKRAMWVDGHDRLHVSEQYAGRPQDGLIVRVEQRTTLAGRAVMLTPEQAAELHEWLGERLAEAKDRPRYGGKTKTLSDLARQPGSRPKRAACRTCLTPESFRGGVSSLSGGTCRDREACEAVQPALPLNETP